MAERDGVGAPGWRRGVGLAVLAQLLSVMGFSCAVSFMPLYVQTLGVESPARAAIWAGSLSFAQAFAVALCSPLWGAVADRFGAKLMVERAMFGGAVVFGAVSLAGRVQQLLVLFIVLGCFTGVNTAIATLVSGLAPRTALGTAIGWCQTGVFAGASVGPLLGGLLADTFSFRAGILSGAALLLLAGLVVLAGIAEPARPPADPATRPRGRAGFRPARPSRPLLLLIATTFTVQFSLQLMTPVLPIFVQSLVPGTNRVATLVGLVLAAGGVAGAGGAVLWGRAADRLGQRRVLGWTALGGTIALTGQAFAGGIVPLLLCRGLAGLFTGGLTATTNAAIGLLAPVGSRGAAFGIAGSAFSLGNALGPLLGGILAAAVGPRAALAVSASALGLAWGVVRALPGVHESEGLEGGRATLTGASPKAPADPTARG